ncbi:hypothetical protein Dda_0747 [Drechslerella dactyloides]|uniref:Glutaredoxin n=1 Tax=Drechslerella dactyloides TaxID=74499 RepID=A0AAD6J4U3_DREDA|nr:hypothetical protein Dda_0747 [Drechslerella dactyloides]
MTSEVQDPKILYLYVSLSTGTFANSSATSRIETILKINKIPFKAIDVATDDRARSIWGRRRRPDQKLPALVKDGAVLGDLAEVEEWNEFGELKQKLGIATAAGPALSQKATTSTVDTKPAVKQAIPSSSTTTSPTSSTAAPSSSAAAPSSSTAALAAEAAAAANKKKEEAKK